MKTVIVHGQSHRGSTYHIANLLADQIGGEKTKFFLPRDFGSFCCGCAKCFMVDEKKCPHYDKLAPITRALDEADYQTERSRKTWFENKRLFSSHADAAEKRLKRSRCGLLETKGMER